MLLPTTNYAFLLLYIIAQLLAQVPKISCLKPKDSPTPKHPKHQFLGLGSNMRGI
jgi:hypothetical protein